MVILNFIAPPPAHLQPNPVTEYVDQMYLYAIVLNCPRPQGYQRTKLKGNTMQLPVFL